MTEEGARWYYTHPGKDDHAKLLHHWGAHLIVHCTMCDV